MQPGPHWFDSRTFSPHYTCHLSLFLDIGRASTKRALGVVHPVSNSVRVCTVPHQARRYLVQQGSLFALTCHIVEAVAAHLRYVNAKPL
jgi:hypothetical protein